MSLCGHACLCSMLHQAKKSPWKCSVSTQTCSLIQPAQQQGKVVPVALGLMVCWPQSCIPHATAGVSQAAHKQGKQRCSTLQDCLSPPCLFPAPPAALAPSPGCLALAELCLHTPSCQGTARNCVVSVFQQHKGLSEPHSWGARRAGLTAQSRGAGRCQSCSHCPRPLLSYSVSTGVQPKSSLGVPKASCHLQPHPISSPLLGALQQRTSTCCVV